MKVRWACAEFSCITGGTPKEPGHFAERASPSCHLNDTRVVAPARRFHDEPSKLGFGLSYELRGAIDWIHAVGYTENENESQTVVAMLWESAGWARSAATL